VIPAVIEVVRVDQVVVQSHPVWVGTMGLEVVPRQTDDVVAQKPPVAIGDVRVGIAQQTPGPPVLGPPVLAVRQVPGDQIPLHVLAVRVAHSLPAAQRILAGISLPQVILQAKPARPPRCGLRGIEHRRQRVVRLEEAPERLPRLLGGRALREYPKVREEANGIVIQEAVRPDAVVVRHGLPRVARRRSPVVQHPGLLGLRDTVHRSPADPPAVALHSLLEGLRVQRPVALDRGAEAPLGVHAVDRHREARARRGHLVFGA